MLAGMVRTDGESDDLKPKTLRATSRNPLIANGVRNDFRAINVSACGEAGLTQIVQQNTGGLA